MFYYNDQKTAYKNVCSVLVSISSKQVSKEGQAFECKNLKYLKTNLYKWFCSCAQDLFLTILTVFD